MIKSILVDYLSGMGIGTIISLIPYWAITKKGIGLTVLTAGTDSLQSFLGMALCCGVFVLGPILKQLRSRSLTVIPSFLILISAIYVYFSNSTVHTISSIFLWIATIALIPLGAIPALLSRVIPGVSTIGALFISGAFGIGFVLLYTYFPIDFHLRTWFLSFYSLHFPHRGGCSSAHYESGAYSGSSTYSGSSSHSNSQSNSTDDHEQDSFGYPGFYGFRSNSFTESRKNAWGYTDYYDDHGNCVGESRENAWGGVDHYDDHGNYVGESVKNAWGGIDHYDDHGNRVGESD